MRFQRLLLAAMSGVLAIGAGPVASGPTHAATPARTESGTPVAPGETRAHVIFDKTVPALNPGIGRGAKARAATHFKHPAPQRDAAGRAAAPANAPPDPEVLGFAQSGEVTSYAWRQDFNFNLLSTIAYFGVNTDGQGNLVNDSGFQGFWSPGATDMINAAHATGDRVVLTIKDFDTASVDNLLAFAVNRQHLIASIIVQLSQRGVDGVNIDFEAGGNTAGFTALISEMRGAMQAQIPQSAYITVDTFASAAGGGELWDVAALAPYLDAFMVMDYDIEFGRTLPNAPLTGPYTYSDTNVVNSFLARAPASEVILGVPYYGYKYSTTTANFNAPRGGDFSLTADTYSGILSDFSCAQALAGFMDGASQTPWARWWSPAIGDPCAGNHGSWRELYYDNNQSLGAKYDLVNNAHLRGIGIWALGYDSGSNDFWNEISVKFSVNHGPTATVNALPASEAGTEFPVCWTVQGFASHSILWIRDNGSGWMEYTDTPSTCTTFFGRPGHTYDFAAQPFDGIGRSLGPPGGTPSATTSISRTAPPSAPFRGMYGVDGNGLLHPVSSGPLPISAAWAGWDIARGIALDADGLGGQTLDGFGGLHPFGSALTMNGSGYWPGWDIARGIVLRPDARGGYVVDGFGGVHAFGTAPAVRVTGFWPGWDIARAIVLRPDGASGYVLDGLGGLHPFAAPGVLVPATPATVYWPGWDIANSVALRADGVSGYTLDGFGGLHAFGGAAGASSCCYWPGWDIARVVSLLPGGGGYVTDGYGGVHPFGGAPGVVASFYAGRDVLRGAGLT